MKPLQHYKPLRLGRYLADEVEHRSIRILVQSLRLAVERCSRRVVAEWVGDLREDFGIAKS